MERYIVYKVNNWLPDLSVFPRSLSSSEVRSVVYEYYENKRIKISPPVSRWCGCWEFDSEENARSFISRRTIQTFWEKRSVFGYDLWIDAYELVMERLDDYGNIVETRLVMSFFDGVAA